MRGEACNAFVRFGEEWEGHRACKVLDRSYVDWSKILLKEMDYR